MLQQTSVAAATPYFERFTARWPNVSALASAPRVAVLEAWAGLGYYARARNLHTAAQELAANGFPADEAGWRALPGVGPYTAAAIAAIAYGQPGNAVDGNVERVMARLHAYEGTGTGAKRELCAFAEELITAHRPGDWVQALMDLGATVCTPRSPKCGICPWRALCRANREGAPERYPARLPRAARPKRYGAVYCLQRGEQVWCVRRPETGLLAGAAGLPTSPWRSEPLSEAEALSEAPWRARWRRLGVVRQLFTHFALELTVYAGAGAPRGEGWWGELHELPSAFRKAAALGRRQLAAGHRAEP
jgi:A/G-specific adenine glycosylase